MWSMPNRAGSWRAGRGRGRRRARRCSRIRRSAPWVMPPLMPPPAIQIEKPLMWWSRPLPWAIGRAAELAAPDHQRVVEHAALFQVLDQRGRSLVDLRGGSLDVLLDRAVMVPVAMVELDEPHAALGQAAGQQAVGARTSRRRPSCRTCPGCAWARSTGRSARARWSASGTPSRRRRSGWRSRGRRRFRSRSNRARGRRRPRRAGGRRSIPCGPADVENRVALGVEPHALEPAGQEAAVPLPRGDRLGLAEVAVEVRTTKPGRSSLSLPRP